MSKPNPFRFAHPQQVMAALDALNPDRPPTPWDLRIERLLNGLREPHLYLGRTLADGIPWLFARSLLECHAHYLGGTGTGKTSLGIMPLAAQLSAYADSSLVYIDMKGGRALFWSAFVEAKRAGLPFRWFTIEPGAASYAWNPFLARANKHRSTNALAQALLVGMGLYHGEAYGKGYFGTAALDFLTRALAKFTDVRSFADLSRYAEEPGSYVATGTDYESSHHLRMTLRQLAAVEPLNVTATSKPAVRPEVVRNAIDLSDVLAEKQVVYFFLPSLEAEVTAKSVARLVTYFLVHAAKIESRKRATHPVYCFIDEAQQVLGEHTKILLEMSRSMGVHFVLGHQDVSQLKTADYDITSTVESCTTLKVAYDASSFAALRQMEEYGGESLTPTLSWQQRFLPGFDEDDLALSPDRAYPTRDFEPPLLTVGERERPRFTRNEILAVSAHPLRAFVRSRSDKGLTQYEGKWTVIECEFATTSDEYKARTKMPMPAEHPSCVTVSERPEERPGKRPAPPNNKPLPVEPPPPSVDRAIADRLKSLRDSIRGTHGAPPEGT